MTKLKDLPLSQITALKNNTRKFRDMESWEQEAMRQACAEGVLEYRDTDGEWHSRSPGNCFYLLAFRIKKSYIQPEEPHVCYAIRNAEGKYLRKDNCYRWAMSRSSSPGVAITWCDAGSARRLMEHVGRTTISLQGLHVVELSISVCECEAPDELNDRLDEVEREFNDKIDGLKEEISEKINSLRREERM